MLGVPLFGLHSLFLIGSSGEIAYGHRPGITVQLEINLPGAVALNLADGVELDDEGLSRLDVQGGLLSRLQTVEEDGGRNERGVGIQLAVLVQFRVNVGIEDVGDERLVVDLVAHLLFQFLPFDLKLHRFQHSLKLIQTVLNRYEPS